MQKDPTIFTSGTAIIQSKQPGREFTFDDVEVPAQTIQELVLEFDSVFDGYPNTEIQSGASLARPTGKKDEYINFLWMRISTNPCYDVYTVAGDKTLTITVLWRKKVVCGSNGAECNGGSDCRGREGGRERERGENRKTQMLSSNYSTSLTHWFQRTHRMC